jgi:hypothetical protein
MLFETVHLYTPVFFTMGETVHNTVFVALAGDTRYIETKFGLACAPIEAESISHFTS